MARDLIDPAGSPLRDYTLETLPEHLLQIILETVYEDTQRFVPIDRREFLSLESLHPVQPDTSTLSNFRLVCKHFSELGLAYQFSRVTTRFSRQGFLRLNKIAACVRAAKCTRRFVYMIPYFFVEGHQQLADLFERHSPNNISANELGSLHIRRENQEALLRSGEDVRSLTGALSAFTALQHVQLNPVLDTAMLRLVNFLESRERQGQGLGHLVQLKWAPACRHGLYSLGQALAISHAKCNKISIPAMDQDSATTLCSSPVPRLSTFVHNLTSLILQFVTADAQGLSVLSPHFRAFLSQTTNLEAIHIGFPMTHPLDVRLDDVFHGIRWTKLRALGIQSWRVGPDEIVDVARRHKRTLRGLRLREILLKEGRWSDVLQILRNEMVLLDWVSLRRIDYAQHFDTTQAGQGFEIGGDDDDPEHEPFGAMSIETSSSDGDSSEGSGDEADREANAGNDEDFSGEIESDPSNGESDHNPVADQLDLPISSYTAATALPLQRTAHELIDDGTAVSGRQTTKAWETWVTARQTK